MSYFRKRGGGHSFATGEVGVDGTHGRAEFGPGLTDAQVAFLSRNPAAVRVCVLQGSFDPSWLDGLMAAAAAIDLQHSGAVH